MRRYRAHRARMVLLLVALLLAGGLLHTEGAPTQAGRARVAMNVTLSIYTCCGSLAGFTDTNASDLSSMHSIYGALWAGLFPDLKWQETAFQDQATLETHLARAVRAGTPPDLVFIQGNYAGYLVLQGLAQPLDRYFAAYHLPANYFLPGMERWAHFGGHWWAIPAVSGPLGGQQIYLPKYMSPLGYDNHNLRTFDDFYRMSEKAVRFDSAGNLLRIGYWPGLDSWETIGTLMCPVGHGLYDPADQPTATDPCNVAYLSYLKKLADLYGGYAKLEQFLATDPQFLGGSRKAYLVTGKALAPSEGYAYWNVPALDSYHYGLKTGVSYQLTPMPVTVHGTLSEAANYPTTQQEIIIPPGAQHADAAFTVSKTTFWDNNYLLGRATSGSPVVQHQDRWLTQLIDAEAATRRQAGLPGNPVAALQGVKLQPMFGVLSKAANPINPVDIYYQQQLAMATRRALMGQESPQQALAEVQQRVLAEEQRLKARYGGWNW